MCATKMCQKVGAGGFCDGCTLHAQSYITVSGYILCVTAVYTIVKAELLMLVVSEKPETKQVFSK